MRSRSFAVAALVLAGTLVPTAPTAVATPAPSTRTVRVGTVQLHRCDLGTSKPAYCGSLQVPLDYTDSGAAHIRVGFAWIPATGARRTLMAEEGGPGYPSTGSAVDYLNSFGSLTNQRNLLLVDERGTGTSADIDCEPLQSLTTPSTRTDAAIARCGRQLNHTYRNRQTGGWVHASDLFTTANAARDAIRVLDALELHKIDLYGDSYGTYFSQSFLSRYPHRLRSVVLDSAYEARDLDPWYTTTVTTARRAFDAVCRDSLGCPRGTSSWQRIGRLAALLRRHAVQGMAAGTDGRRVHIRFGITALVNVVNDAGYDTEPYRQLDAATRAYLDHRDAAPLLRLYAQDIGYDYGDYRENPRYYSDGQYFAVACTDYPQLFDMRDPPAQRRRQLAHAIAVLPKRTFAPFTTREWLTVLPYTETFTGCLNWPTITHHVDRPTPPGHPLDATHVPVLILNGSLDSLTPAAGGAHIARQIGPAARHVVVANEVHLTIEDVDFSCGRVLMNRFVRHPHAHLDTACARKVPPIRAVTRYPRTVYTAPLARGAAPAAVRRLASVAVLETGDAVYRRSVVSGHRDLGLYGGTVRYGHGSATLQAVRFVRDVRISGVVHEHDGAVRAVLTLRGPRRTYRDVVVRYAERAVGASRRASVVLDGAQLSAPAP